MIQKIFEAAVNGEITEFTELLTKELNARIHAAIDERVSDTIDATYNVCEECDWDDEEVEDEYFDENEDDIYEDEEELEEAIKYDAAHPESGITGKVTGKGKRDRGPGGQVNVKYTGHPAYGDKGGKLPIKARDIGRLLRTARKPGTTAYDSRNVRNPRLTKDHVELEGLDLSEMNFLGKDKKFGREFYEKDGQLHVKKPGGTYVQNLGSVSVPSNKKMMKGLVKDSNESFEKLTPAQERDAQRRLKPTRATVAKVRLRATGDEIADKVKKWKSEKGGNPGNTKNRRQRDLQLRDRLRDHVEIEEAKKKKKAKKDHDGDGKIETPTAEWKGSRDKAIKAAIAARGGN